MKRTIQQEPSNPEEGKHDLLIKVDLKGRKVAVGFDGEVKPPFEALSLATVHMMSLCTLESSQDIEETLRVLCEAARQSRTLWYNGSKPQ